MVDGIIIENGSSKTEDEDKDILLDDDDRHLIDMVLQLSLQSEANTTDSTATATANSQHNLTNMDPNFVESIDPNFLVCVQPLQALHTKLFSSYQNVPLSENISPPPQNIFSPL